MNSHEVKYFQQLIPYYHENFQEALQNSFLQPILHHLENLSNKEFFTMKENLPYPFKIEPNTIGSYLFGYSYAHYGDVSMECSPLAITSREYEGQCSSQVWLYKNGGNLEKIQDANSKNAYVFFNTNISSPFSFSEEQKELLQKEGVEKAFLYALDDKNHQLLETYVFPPINQNNNRKKRSHTLWDLQASRKASAGDVQKEKEEQNVEIEPKSFFEEASQDSLLWFLIPFALLLLILFFLF